jgi:hypothetical protein
MTYTKQTWSDNNPLFPASAARFDHIEQGVFDAHNQSSQLLLGTAQTTDYTTATTDINAVIQVNSSSVKKISVAPDSVLTTAQTGSSLYVLNIGSADAYIAPSIDNLVQNPSVETNSAGYSGRSSTPSAVTVASTPAAGALYGTSGMRFTTTAASGTTGMFYSMGLISALGLKVGDKVSCSYLINAAGIPSGAAVGIRFQSGATVIGSDSLGNNITTSGTSKVDGATIPAGCDTIVLLIFATSSGVGQYIDADGLLFVKGPTAPAYTDPSLNAEMSWLGTAHASRSQLPKVTGSVTTVSPGGISRVVRTAANTWALVSQPPSDVMLDTDAFYADRDLGLGGLFAPFLAATTSQAMVAGTQYICRFAPSRDMLMSGITFRVETASGSNDNVEVALYDSALTRVAVSTATASKMNATGEQTVNFSTAFNCARGSVYYASILVPTFGGTAPSIAQVTSGGSKLAGAAAPSALIMTKTGQATSGSSISGPSAAVTGPELFVKV